MAALEKHPSPAPDASLQAMLKFISAMWSIPSVQRVGFATEQVPPGAHLWVFFNHDDPGGFEQAVLAERTLRQDVESDLLYVHFFAVDEVKEDLLPSIATVFSR
jgi:hypothetical protein